MLCLNYDDKSPKESVDCQAIFDMTDCFSTKFEVDKTIPTMIDIRYGRTDLPSFVIHLKILIYL